MKNIPYGRQSISAEDIHEVCQVLSSDWLTQGPVISQFEEAVAAYCKSKYAIAVSSATSALHLACLALDLGAGDYLWTSPNTFVASANCALYCGAQVDFVDIDLKTYNMCIKSLEEKLIQAEKTGKLPKIVIPVHFAGQSCDMKKIKELSQRYGFKVVEDASHAIGGSYQNEKIGACTYSDITVFSFHPVKIITTGEGGMLLTNNEMLRTKLLQLRTHGITRNTAEMEGESHGPWYYQQINLGMNYRITDIQAALGLSQLKRIDDFIALRKQYADSYTKKLADLPLTLPYQISDAASAWHLYVVMLDLEKIKHSRLTVFEKLRSANIGVNVHYVPVHTQPYYRKNGFATARFNNAEHYYERAITLPLYPTMTENDQSRVVETLGAALV